MTNRPSIGSRQPMYPQADSLVRGDHDLQQTTAAVIQRVHSGVSEAEQAWILAELIR